MTTTISRGGLEYFDQLQKNFEAHWREVGYDSKFGEFELDRSAYETMDNCGLFLGIGAKSGDTPIAYMSILMFYHPHCKGLKIAQTDAFYIHPYYRGLKSYAILCKMVREAETILKDEYKVKIFNISFPYDSGLDTIMKRLEYGYLDTIMTKRL